MAKLPKALIKKYGISKKAWAVFRGSRATTKKTRSRSRSGSRKTTTRGLYMAKRKGYRKGSKGGFMKNVGKILLGAGVAALYEVFISPMIPLNRTIKNIVEMIAGIILAAMPKLPMAVRAGGAALATINAFELLVPLISNVSGKTSSIGGGSNGLAGLLQN